MWTSICSGLFAVPMLKRQRGILELTSHPRLPHESQIPLKDLEFKTKMDVAWGKTIKIDTWSLYAGMQMCMCISLCRNTHMCMCTHIYTYTLNSSTHTCIYTSVHSYTYLGTHSCARWCTHTHTLRLTPSQMDWSRTYIFLSSPGDCFPVQICEEWSRNTWAYTKWSFYF